MEGLWIIVFEGQVNIHWGVGTGAKGDRTYFFFARKMIGRQLFSFSILIGHEHFSFIPYDRT